MRSNLGDNGVVCLVHMTDSRGTRAGEQSNKGKSLYNVKWNESPMVVGGAWLSQFKRRSIATSVSNSAWKVCRRWRWG